jgi:Flp pilus assembly protein TadG
MADLEGRQNRVGPRRGLRALARDNSAVAAVEFAVLGPVFLLLVCMILELGMALFTQSIMDNALRDAARLIRVGQAPSSTTFVAAVCDKIGSFLGPSCTTSLQYYVASASSFGTLTPETGTLSDSYTSGGSGADMLAEIGYDRATLIPWATEFFGASQMLISTVVFQNEPY